MVFENRCVCKYECVPQSFFSINRKQTVAEISYSTSEFCLNATWNFLRRSDNLPAHNDPQNNFSMGIKLLVCTFLYI